MGRVINDLVTATNGHDVNRAANLVHKDYRSEQPAAEVVPERSGRGPIRD